MKKEGLAGIYSKKAGELSEGRIGVKLPGSSGEVFYEIALEMLSIIEENNRKKEERVFIVPVGPVGQYPIFTRLVNERRADLSGCTFINMDENLTEEKKYVDTSSKLSFRACMEKNVYSKIPCELNVREENRIFPDPVAPGRILEVIRKKGKLDAVFGGVGINGHIAFNEAEDVRAEEFALRSTRVLAIRGETRTVNAIADLNGALDEFLLYAVTVGMKEILLARKIRLSLFRPWHRSVLRRALFSEPTGAFPVTLNKVIGLCQR